MASGWIWTIWAVVMVAFSYYALVADLGQYELVIFMLGAFILSAAAAWYDGKTNPSMM